MRVIGVHDNWNVRMLCRRRRPPLKRTVEAATQADIHPKSVYKMSQDNAQMQTTNKNVQEFEATKAGKDISASPTSSLVAHNVGNPVFTCPVTIESRIDKENPEEDWFAGYGLKKQHPMYMTSAMEVGSRKPTVHTMPNTFHAKSQKFTNHLGECGMYRNYSLNTATDKSIV